MVKKNRGRRHVHPSVCSLLQKTEASLEFPFVLFLLSFFGKQTKLSPIVEQTLTLFMTSQRAVHLIVARSEG